MWPVCTSVFAVGVRMVPEGMAMEFAGNSWAMVAGSMPLLFRVDAE